MTGPLRILSLGAGVQSSTVLLMSCLGELPRFDRALFADTGWEPKAVYDHLAWLTGEAQRYGITVEQVSRGDLRANLTPTPGVRFVTIPVFLRMPSGSDGMSRRQCTREYKLEPLVTRQRELAGLQPRQRTNGRVLVESYQGISWDEVHRVRDAVRPWIRNVYPLVDLKMSRQDCLDWCHDHGYPRPPRSACIGCPYHSDREWLDMRTNDPVSWADACEADELVRKSPGRHGTGYLHHQRRPLADVVLQPEDAGQLTFGDECEGMCGL